MDNWALFSHAYMYDLSTWPVFDQLIVVFHTSTRGATYFCCIFRNSKRFTWIKLFEMCVYICWLIIHCMQTEIYSKVNLKKRKWFVINCTNSDRSDDLFYLCSEKIEKHDEYLNNHKSWMKFFASGKSSIGLFLPLWCGGLPKWLKVNVSSVCWWHTTVESWLQG